MPPGPVASSAATSGSSADADAVAELELRVPAAKFTGVVEEIAKLGRAAEPGDQHRGRHRGDRRPGRPDRQQRARVDSARRLLARATSITDLVSLENELGRTGGRPGLAGGQEATPGRPDRPVHDHRVAGRARAKATEEKAETGFLVGLRGGWKAFVASMTVLLTVLGALLPWLVALGVPLAVLLVVLRRRREVPAPVAPVSAPPPVPAARSAP